VHNAFLAVTAAFLFGYQMHEKTILLPLVIISLAYPCHSTSVLCVNITSMLSLFDLLRRDGHATTYALAILLLIATALYARPQRTADCVGLAVTVSAVVFLHASQELLPPPAKYPWLYPYLSALISCARRDTHAPIYAATRM
jgi:alpha-1,3-glucosyltransferase